MKTNTERTREFRDKNKHYMRDYTCKNKDKINARRNVNHKLKMVNDADYARKRKDIELRRKYNISVEQFEWLSSEQDHKCFLCKRKRNLCVDHDHETGMVRALLCKPCNNVIGAIEATGDDWEERVKTLLARGKRVA